MQSGAITDGQVTASSQFRNTHAAHYGRLHFQANSSISGGWSAATSTANQWFQVDLGNSHMNITRVATQGRNGYPNIQAVSTYNLQYSNDGVNFQYYKEQGQITIKVN